MQIKSTNKGLFRARNTLLSTVNLPFPIDGTEYETCLFINDESEVVSRYLTLDEAIAGHAFYEKKYDLIRI